MKFSGLTTPPTNDFACALSPSFETFYWVDVSTGPQCQLPRLTAIHLPAEPTKRMRPSRNGRVAARYWTYLRMLRSYSHPDGKARGADTAVNVSDFESKPSSHHIPDISKFEALKLHAGSMEQCKRRARSQAKTVTTTMARCYCFASRSAKCRGCDICSELTNTSAWNVSRPCILQQQETRRHKSFEPGL